MMSYPYPSYIHENFVEIVDNNERPLMLMPHAEAVQKHLPYRQIHLILRDTAGCTLLCRAKTESQNTVWALPTTWVHAREAYENAIERLLTTELAAPEWLSFHAITKKHTMHEHTTLFVVHLEHEHAKDLGDDLLILDYDELQGLNTHFSDMLCPKLHQLIHQGTMNTALETDPNMQS